VTLARLTGSGLAVNGIDSHQTHEALDSLAVDLVIDPAINLIS